MMNFYTDQDGKPANGEAQGHLNFKEAVENYGQVRLIEAYERQPHGWEFLGNFLVAGECPTAEQVLAGYEAIKVPAKMNFYTTAYGYLTSGEAQGEFWFEEVEFCGYPRSFEVCRREPSGWDLLGEFEVAIKDPNWQQVFERYKEMCVCVKSDEIRCDCLVCEKGDD